MSARRSPFVAAAALLGYFCCGDPAFGSPVEPLTGGGGRPNIILILADDLGMVEVSSYGGAESTPNIDALAASGIRFNYAYSAPQCAPTRAQLLAGNYPFRNGVIDGNTGHKLSPSNTTSIAKQLRKAGYATAAAGKWFQLQYMDTAAQGRAWGFDEFLTWNGGQANKYWGPTFNMNGVVTTHPDHVFGPDLLHDFVVDFMTRHKTQPFFVYYPAVSIHYLLAATPDNPDETNERQIYVDNIAYLDDLVGRLVTALDSLGIRQNTLILFVGDNGSAANSESLQLLNGRVIDGTKGTLREGGSRVPFIASWPATTPAGVVNNDLISFADVFPTLAELGVATSPAPIQTIDGLSFAPQLHGQVGQSRPWVYVQFVNDCYLRNPLHKLYCTANVPGAFVDMRNAPYGEVPLNPPYDPQQQAAYDALKAALRVLKKP